MIIARITGGLGNQMFQYAMARSVAIANGASLKLDLRSYTHYPLHNGYELQRVFGIMAAEAAKSDLTQVLGWRATSLIFSFLCRRKMDWARGQQFKVEPYFSYWSNVKSIRDNSYLYGFWQSQRYFYHIEPSLRQEFIFRQPLLGRNAEICDQIASCNAVSLHIRRADYASDSATNCKHGLCSLAYYQKAINLISSSIPRPEFFVFSDDISWAESNLSCDYPLHFVNNNKGVESHHDMHLMSICRHHIIANSSFSWWGAWLNSDPSKIVAAPKQWFAIGGFDVRDLFPPQWILL